MECALSWSHLQQSSFEKKKKKNAQSHSNVVLVEYYEINHEDKPILKLHILTQFQFHFIYLYIF